MTDTWNLWEAIEDENRAAKATLGLLLEAMHAPCGTNENEDAVFGIWQMLDRQENAINELRELQRGK